MEAVVATDQGDRVVFSLRGVDVAEYVYRPTDVTLESPRPYFSPLRTTSGRVVTAFRPDDHVWHKGIAWSLPVVGDQNFWGGPTFVRGKGYVQLPNNGTQLHVGFDRVESGDVALIVETLTWITEAGEHVFDERRTATARHLDDKTWLLTFSTRMTNVSPREMSIGSPTTRGRDNAGYAGLFWRGPRSFTGGVLVAPDREGGDELRGQRAPWMGFRGTHAEGSAVSTILMVDGPRNRAHPPQWFARSQEFAALNPGSFFSEERLVAAGESMVESTGVVIHDAGLGPKGAAVYAERATSVLGSMR